MCFILGLQLLGQIVIDRAVGIVDWLPWSKAKTCKNKLTEWVMWRKYHEAMDNITTKGLSLFKTKVSHCSKIFIWGSFAELAGMLGRVAAAFFAAFSLFVDPLLGLFPMRWVPRMLHLAISGAGCSCFHSFCQSVQIVSVLASKSEIDEGSQLLGKPSHPVPAFPKNVGGRGNFLMV